MEKESRGNKGRVWKIGRQEGSKEEKEGQVQKKGGWRSPQSAAKLLSSKNKVNTFLLRVLIMNSRARCVAGCGSNGLITILLSSGSPGTICTTKQAIRRNNEQYEKWRLLLCLLKIH